MATHAGDQSGNLLWRITVGGEWPTVHMPKTVYLLIGTNDLTFADCHEDMQEIKDAAVGIIDRCGTSSCCVQRVVQCQMLTEFCLRAGCLC